MDGRRIIRVVGRLQLAAISYDTQHLVVLPYNDTLVKLLIQQLQGDHLHCGPKTLLSHVRERFWPIKGKLRTRSTVQHCVPCSRSKTL